MRGPPDYSKSQPGFDLVIGLGANLGDRQATIESAVRQLGTLGQLAGVSALYETPPLGPPQPDYLNAAVRLRTHTPPEQFLRRLLLLEQGAGRERRERWGPRTLDLDLLWGAGVVVDSPGLSLPHPELTRRAFALLPLLDVAPDARDPRSGVRYAELRNGLDEVGVLQRPWPFREALHASLQPGADLAPTRS